MQVLDRRTGKYFEAPDNGTDDDILSAHSASGMENLQPPSLAQSFIQAGAPAVGTLAQSLAQGPQRSTLPNIGGAGMIGLSPQQAQFVLQSAQQSNVDAQTQQLRQQELTQQSIEGEKNRSQEIKLYQQRIKNDMAIAKAQAEVDKFEAELRAKGKDADNAMRLQLEEMRNQAAYLRDQAKLYNLAPGAVLKDSQGNLIADNPKQEFGGGLDPNKIVGQDTILMKDPATGEDVPVRINIFANGDYGVIGPAPSGGRSTGGQGTGGARGGGQDVDPLQMEKLVQNSAAASWEAQSAKDTSLTWQKHLENTRNQIRSNVSGNQFQTGVLLDEFKRTRSAELQQQGIPKEQAEKMAEVEGLKRSGVRAAIVNGEVVYDMTGMQQATVPQPQMQGGIGEYVDGPWSQR